jgi:hypothetical protein
MRQALLRCLCSGQNKTQAAASLGFKSRVILRYVSKHEQFGKAVDRAVELGATEHVPLVDIERLIAAEQPNDHLDEHLDEHPTPAAPSLTIVKEAPEPATEPSLPILAEVVATTPAATKAPTKAPTDPTVRAFLALTWGKIDDPAAPAIVQATAMRCLHDHFKARDRRELLLLLKSGGSPSGGPPSGPPAERRERGLTMEAVLRFRRLVIGPPPGSAADLAEQQHEDEQDDEQGDEQGDGAPSKATSTRPSS